MKRLYFFSYLDYIFTLLWSWIVFYYYFALNFFNHKESYAVLCRKHENEFKANWNKSIKDELKLIILEEGILLEYFTILFNAFDHFCKRSLALKEK